MKKTSIPGTVFWSSFIFILCSALALYVAALEAPVMEAGQVPAAQTSLEPAILYFLAVALVMGIVLSVIPLSRLKMVLRAIFAVLFSWGTFILFGFSLPLPLAVAFSVACGLMWLFRPLIWLHDVLMVFSMAAIGAVFGFLFAPFTAVALLFALAIYDILAVRLGYMMWLVKKLSQSDTLPVFVIPKRLSDWNLDLKKAGFHRMLEERSERELSILGGGDIGLPLLVVVSVFFAYGLAGALVMAAFSLAGLVAAYWVQIVLLKGEPLPALPPISFATSLGFLVVRLLAS